MRIHITVKTKARETAVEKIDGTHFKVSVTEPPQEGKANYAIVKALARHFGIPLLAVEIISGTTSRQKVVELMI